MPTRYTFCESAYAVRVWIAVEFIIDWELDDCRSLRQGWWWLAVAPCECFPSEECLPCLGQIIRLSNVWARRTRPVSGQRWRSSLGWCHFCGKYVAFGVAVMARAFRNAVATGLGCFFFFFNNVIGPCTAVRPYHIASILLFVAPSSLVILKFRNTRDGAQRSPAYFFLSHVPCFLLCTE